MSNLSGFGGSGSQYKTAVVRYAGTPPTQEQVENIKRILSKKIGIDDISITTQLDPSIGGGFIIRCGNYEYDWSDKGRAEQLRNKLKKSARSSAATSGIISLMTKST